MTHYNKKKMASSSASSKFLIVGLGATGSVVARTLHENGAQVAAFVRSPGTRVQTVNLMIGEEEPQDLHVSVFSSLSEVAEFRPDVVIVTFDHTGLASEAGGKLLKGLVEACPATTTFTAFQPGLDTVEIYLEAGLSRSRVVFGAFQLISRAIQKDSVDSSTKIFEYFLLNPPKLFICESSGEAAEALKKALSTYGLGFSGVPAHVFNCTIHLLFPYLAACALDGWRKGGPSDEKLALACGAMSEMAAVNQGVLPKLLSWLAWSPRVIKPILNAHRQQFSPYMDYDEFGNQHHNIKVGQQNFDILVQHQRELKKAGKPTKYLDELIALVKRAQCMG